MTSFKYFDPSSPDVRFYGRGKHPMLYHLGALSYVWQHAPQELLRLKEVGAEDMSVLLVALLHARWTELVFAVATGQSWDERARLWIKRIEGPIMQWARSSARSFERQRDLLKQWLETHGLNKQWMIDTLSTTIATGLPKQQHQQHQQQRPNLVFFQTQGGRVT